MITGVVSAMADLVVAVMQTSHGGGSLLLLLAGPFGGGATYWAIYRYYLNADKTFDFERETMVKAQPVQGGEQKVDHISRTRKSSVDHDNVDRFRERVQRVR